MPTKHLLAAAALCVAVLLIGCATAPSSDDLDRQALVMIKASFREQGIAKLDRLDQDTSQAACSGRSVRYNKTAKPNSTEGRPSISSRTRARSW